MEKQQNKTTKIWSTKEVIKYNNDIDEGIERKDSPYFNNDQQLRKPHLLYEYTTEELETLLKCKKDINYFANSFAYTMNPSTGALNQITLRDYQEDLLNTINENRYTIIVASRQSGKCVTYNTKIKTSNGDKIIGELFNDIKPFYRKILNLLYKIYKKL